MDEKKIIRKVWRGSNEQMCITIPRDEGITYGDYVEVIKIKTNGRD